MKDPRALTRRDFLKLSGLGLMGLMLPEIPLKALNDPYNALSGRVASPVLWTYDRPSAKAQRVKMYWRDLILPITNVTVDEDDPDAYNRIWYQVGNDGYAYSGSVQPVRTVLNTPTLTIPATGQLAEVTVPFTDALIDPDPKSKVGYRIYYETVHWVMSAAKSTADNQIWYQILDDKWDKLYYVPGAHLRLLPDSELAPLSPNIPDDKKRIEVHLADQYLVAYEYETPVFMTRVASGAVLRVGTYHTPRGLFTTYHKRATRHMAAGDITASGFDLPGVPWVMYFTESGISLHGTYWHNDFGHPRSHGCVNLTPQAAKWLFRWTAPYASPHDEFTYKSPGTTLLIQD
ncbi:MAG: L,D-transpeptidase [Chloroflexi bacterium]|nr:L,D-transpeptidase [Chloroflexota bacterium]